MKNYDYLLNIRFKYFSISIVIIGILMITLLLSIFIKTYTSYQTLGIYMQGVIVVSVPIENSDAVNNGDYLTINGKQFKYKIEDISELQVVNFNNYQDYYININKNFRNNEVVKITFYYDKQIVLKKIMEIIF